MPTDSTILLAPHVKYRRYSIVEIYDMNYKITGVAFFVVITSLVALLVVGTEDMGNGHTVFANRSISGHVAFANRGINVETDTNQDQGCEGVGGTSGITNACTATSGPGSTETSTETPVTLGFTGCGGSVTSFSCGTLTGPGCNNLGCSIITCVGNFFGVFNCTTDNGIPLTSCTYTQLPTSARISCTLTQTHTVPGTGISNSGGIS
jgi:hypothetical protein